jgi:hypothetical protein
MKATQLLFLFSLIFPFSSSAQEKKVRCSGDLDIGACIVRAEHPSIPASPFSYLQDTVRQQLYVGKYFSFGVYTRGVYILPEWTLGIFIKPAIGMNLSRGTSHQARMAILQFPIYATTEIGKTKEHWPGIIAGAGITFNYYELDGYKIPPFARAAPCFFVQLHFDHYGIRFSDVMNQTILNKNGTITKTDFDFSLTILATLPFEEKSKKN